MEGSKRKRAFAQRLCKFLKVPSQRRSSSSTKNRTRSYSPLLALSSTNGITGQRPLKGFSYEHIAPQLPPGFDSHRLSNSSPKTRYVEPRQKRRQLMKVARRHLKNMPSALFKALFSRRVKPVDDLRFSKIVSNTCLAQFFRPLQDPREGARFSKDGDKEMVILDLSPQGGLNPFDGLYMPASKAYFARVSGNEYHIRAIALDEQLFGPWSPQPTWQLAKYFVLMGSHYRLLLMDHPATHYPGEIISKVTCNILPQGHLLYRLLRPFSKTERASAPTRMLASRREEMFTAFPIPCTDVQRLTAISFEGVPESYSYLPYRFGYVPKTASHYRSFLEDWFRHIHELVRRVVALIPADDPYVAAWADHIAPLLPGFPTAEQITEKGALARTVAAYLLSVSVRPSADRFSYTAIPLNEMPMRLRVPPPSLKIPKTVSLGKMVSREDYYRHQLCHAWLSQDTAQTGIKHIDFGFRNPALQEAASDFRQGMKALDRKWVGSQFPCSTQIKMTFEYF